MERLSRNVPEAVLRAERCELCKWWQDARDPTGGDCHRTPPVTHLAAGPMGQMAGITVWPRCRKEEWCGQFEPRALL